MPDPQDAPFDHRFYSEFRYQGTPEAIIADFCGAAKQLLARLVSDLRSTSKGPFGLESNAEYEQMAVAVERTVGHVDVFQRMALGEGAAPATAPLIQNVVANVLADANAAEMARARASAPKANQAKFDQGKTGSSVEGMKDYADKIKDAGEGIAKILDNSQLEGAFDILAAILEDIALNGSQAAENTGGNEATRQIEEKLDYVMPGVDGLKTGQDQIKKGQADAADVLRRIDGNTIHISSEVDSIEYKAERLGDLLGRTLVGSPWTVERQLHPHTVSNVVPSVSIKDEMHGIEGDLANIINNLNVQIANVNQILKILNVFIQFIVNIFPAWVFNFFNPSITGLQVPPAGSRPLIDERLKKIFVYAEDRFAPQNANDLRAIDVRTPAFDLSGWIDVSDLRPGDIVEITTSMTVAGRARRLDQRRFDRPALLAFSDFARGLQYISGNDARVEISQPASADNFATRVEFGYQFVVESQ
jgi:hypothetical protein